MRPPFFCIFDKLGENEATDLEVSQLRSSTIAINSARVPGPRGRVLARARVQVLQNSVGRMVVLRFTTLSARDQH